MKRFWFEFDISIEDAPPVGTLIGCGVTAYNYDDAIQILTEKIFTDEIPTIISTKENIDVSTLDSNHVQPNIGDPSVRGIWFPLGYE